MKVSICQGLNTWQIEVQLGCGLDSWHDSWHMEVWIEVSTVKEDSILGKNVNSWK